MVKAKSELGGNVETSAEMTEGGPILDVNGEPIDPIWAAEFRGFFWGEGSLIVRVSNAGRTIKRGERGQTFNVHVILSQRFDNGEALREFCRRLGGTCFVKGYYDETDKKILVWQASSHPDCVRIARVLAEGNSSIPFPKRDKELALWLEAVRIRAKGSGPSKVGAASGHPKRRNHVHEYTEEERERLAEIMWEIMDKRKWTG